MEPLKPNFNPNEFKTAIVEVPVTAPLAFRDGEFFRDDVLSELDTD